jgi:malonyl-CoA O-methyltransferase
VRLRGEYLPATSGAEQELVLLHGWGSDRGCWRVLLPALRPWANLTLLDLPGCAPGAGTAEPPDLSGTLAAVLRHCPPQAVYVGWSLGGQLAVELAARHPERVIAVVTVCSNPRFVAVNGWPGMAPALFAGFRTAAQADPDAALRRFDALQVAGAGQPRQLLRTLRTLRTLRSEVPVRGLSAGLSWLASLDQRALLPALEQPQLHLLAARDGLVPPVLGEVLSALLSERQQASVVTLPDCSHAAPLEGGSLVAVEIRRFLRRPGLLRRPPDAARELARDEVADSFSRAASHYDDAATLQREVGSRLLTRLQERPAAPAMVLDLGCGTGYFCPALRRRFPAAAYAGLDLAVGMVRYAREQFPEAGRWLVGDAEALPLAADSVDLVFSNLAIQWCDRPLHLFAELSRVLRSGGRCVFSSLGPGTLRELRAAWAAVDDRQHVNNFLPPAALAEAARQVGGLELRLEREEYRMTYPRVRDLLAELKAIGAHNMTRGRSHGLTSRRALQGMLGAYEAWREEGLLPATYEVLFGVVEKR